MDYLFGLHFVSRCCSHQKQLLTGTPDRGKMEGLEPQTLSFSPDSVPSGGTLPVTTEIERCSESLEKGRLSIPDGVDLKSSVGGGRIVGIKRCVLTSEIHSLSKQMFILHHFCKIRESLILERHFHFQVKVLNGGWGGMLASFFTG